MLQPLKLIQPGEVNPVGDADPFDFSPFSWKFLAEGDSWFSIGGITTNLLMPAMLSTSAVAVNCALPGQKLVHMVDARRSPAFAGFLAGNVAEHWDAILLSGGGNDVIDFLQTPLNQGGRRVDMGLRPLLAPDERDPAANSPAQFVSEGGWAIFAAYLVGQYHEVVGMRDSAASKSQGVPIIVHTYDLITPRPAPAVLAGIRVAGPWIAPAFQRYGIPPGLWNDLSDLFLRRVRDLIMGLQLPNVFAVDTQGTLARADPGTSGPSRDWVNEIHPMPHGYDKLAPKYAAGIEGAMASTNAQTGA